MTANSAKLKGEVATLQKELAELSSSQAELDKIRSDEKAVFTKNSAEMEAGIEGVKKALSVLKPAVRQSCSGLQNRTQDSKNQVYLTIWREKRLLNKTLIAKQNLMPTV